MTAVVLKAQRPLGGRSGLSFLIYSDWRVSSVPLPPSGWPSSSIQYVLKSAGTHFFDKNFSMRTLLAEEIKIGCEIFIDMANKKCSLSDHSTLAFVVLD